MLPSELDRLARACVPGQGAVVLELVATGLVNETYRAARDGRLFSLRLTVDRAADLGLDRDWECRVLRCAGDAGVAPAVELCDPGAGIVVTAWVQGRSWTAAESCQPACIDEFTRLLRVVHGMPVPSPPRVMTPANWIEFYDGIAPVGGVLRARALKHLAWLSKAPPAPAVLCHGDVHRLNLVVDDAARLIDWEYAHVSEPFWDLAGWVANEDWEPAPAHELLTSYLQRSPTLLQSVRLRHLVWLYDYVCLCWSHRYLRGPAAGAAVVAVRAALLEDRLARSGQSPSG